MITSAFPWRGLFSDLLSGEWNSSIFVPVLVFPGGHQFSLIVCNAVYQISQLYLVVHYVESHALGGQCRVKAELMLSTNVIV